MLRMIRWYARVRGRRASVDKWARPPGSIESGAHRWRVTLQPGRRARSECCAKWASLAACGAWTGGLLMRVPRRCQAAARFTRHAPTALVIEGAPRVPGRSASASRPPGTRDRFAFRVVVVGIGHGLTDFERLLPPRRGSQAALGSCPCGSMTNLLATPASKDL
jgi:hypothetical protein